jgi:large subunit ribosomal protein L9
MKLILNRDVTDLGKSGQVVNVSDGYARNFLLPRKLAILADAGALSALEKKRKMIEMKGEKLAAEAQEMAEKINNLKVNIVGKAGSGTKLYGSVTNQEIADALLSQHDVKVDKRTIQIVDPIKSIGTFEVPVKLHHEVTATIHVDVVAQSE